MNDFESAVLLTVMNIPVGKVLSYGEVACRAGFPGRARHVGRVLSRLPASSRIPWHRVVRASGALAFPNEHDDFSRQKKALAADGIVFNGRTVPATYFDRAPSGRRAT